MNRLIFIILFVQCLIASAQHKPMDTQTIQRIKQGVSQSSLKTETIFSEFTQEKEMSILNDKIISSGRFYFKKDGLLRWEYLHPFSYVIAIRGDFISIRDEGKIRTYNTQSDKVFTEVNRIIIGSMNGTLLVDGSFTDDYDQNNGHYIVTLTPLAAPLKENLDKVIIYFNKTDFTVDKLEMVEPAGDYTRITFTKKQLNHPIADEVFILR